MDVFGLHRGLLGDYASYTRSFIRISDPRIREQVDSEIRDGLLWPDPLLQLNPAFEPGHTVDELVQEGLLHSHCANIFRFKRDSGDFGKPMRLHLHQEQAIRAAARNEPYVLTTGTGSGKSLSYIIPAVDHVLRGGSGRGIKAIIVYPMNALANSQKEELDKFLKRGFDGGDTPVSYARYTGQEDEEQREKIIHNPPDILLTNYVMLELILTRVDERQLVRNASELRFLVFDELHTYRGRQGADVAMLIRRCREAFGSPSLHCVGTSATMASVGTSVEQSRVVATVASKIFGEEVPVLNVIGESLRRTTLELESSDPSVVSGLQHAIDSSDPPPTDFEPFHQLPLASWIETTFGLHRENLTRRLIRQKPRPVKGPNGAAAELAELTHRTPDAAALAIERYLDTGSQCRNPNSEYPVFAFRLHQFISRGDTVWASLEPEAERTITLKAQQYVPGNRGKILLPLVFCRHCGQEYYRVDRPKVGHTGPILPRHEFGGAESDETVSGYLYASTSDPWPEELDAILQRVPPDWLEDHHGGFRVRRGQPVPEIVCLNAAGHEDSSGLYAAFVRAPFRFCLNPQCRVAYNPRQRSDVSKLATIGVDGRSTATTILALSTILKLKSDETLESTAKKLLSFTDNRQDASLQAGHFNDFVEVGLIRSGLYRAMTRVGPDGLRYDDLVQHVEQALNLPVHLYSNNPELRGPALMETRRALRSVLSYFLYRDLVRGWRVTAPNLEQCGLLEFDYLGLDELVQDSAYWQEKNPHDALLAASPERRKRVIRVLLDHLRRSIAVREDCLTPAHQERISEQSRQRLREPWVIEEPGDMIQATVAWPRPGIEGDRADDIPISSRGSFGLFLNRPGVLTELGNKLTLQDRDAIISDLFALLKPWGLVEEVANARGGSVAMGYQLPSSIMIWKPRQGERPMVDELRLTQISEVETQGNRYFVDFYKAFADHGSGLEGREHTAQVLADVRLEREEEFRSAELPILFCSPTMELGVDIAQLNVVNMRNVPPTPANYAQRSGRAGRSGQPALVYTYCSGFSPHDQYYFRNPAHMVAGSVTAPRIDLVNQDLIQAHVHAIWLSEARLKLGTTLTEVLSVSEDDLTLPLLERVSDVLRDPKPRLMAKERCQRVLASLGQELLAASWYREGWLDDVLQRLPNRFHDACDRWRSLYRAAVQQRQLQNKIIGDHSREMHDRNRAKSLRSQAETQIDLLTKTQNATEGDFYSYRYFASEGFLPGYNFPRLPLSAFIPARRGRLGKDEFLSRPRFLAISEFGPRATVYHEGSRYRINKANLAFDSDTQELAHTLMKVCSQCGYGHAVANAPVDTCENCGEPLSPTDEIRDMVRLQNVTAKRAERITSDEEERQRLGYEIRSTYRFAVVNGRPDFRRTEIVVDGHTIAVLRYGDAVTIWRINMGWRQRKNVNEHGFMLDLERGFWATNRDAEDGDDEDPMSRRIKRVVPFVQDSRNALTLELENPGDEQTMATLQSALKQGIQQVFQLEPTELAVDPLPSRKDRQCLFFYEASEGGAGVLRQLVDNPRALAEVARAALKLCHFDPQTGRDLGVGQCEAACYECLLEYGNQMDHRLIDRQEVLQILQLFARSEAQISSSGQSRVNQLDELVAQSDSELERKWLQMVHELRLQLPTHAQHLISSSDTRLDFYYAGTRTAVFIDGPVHDAADQKDVDEGINRKLINAGYLVLRFHHKADWKKVFGEYQDIFGTPVE